MASVVMTGDSHHATAGPAMAHDSGTSDSPQHSTCNACDICNGPTMTLALHSASAIPPVHPHTAPTSERFANAVPQRGSKPPIA